ncbi:hypothetical protein SUGI_0036950 [Cryptomeria japonica]|nr:hypothetical protein SUGI_0036950 [Cryptomeria japonica]
MPEVEVYFMDLPSYDFNSLFQMLPLSREAISTQIRVEWLQDLTSQQLCVDHTSHVSTYRKVCISITIRSLCFGFHSQKIVRRV